MFDSLNKLGLPTKYAILGFMGGTIGAYVSELSGFSEDRPSPYLTFMVAGAIGGAIGGYLRKRRGKSD